MKFSFGFILILLLVVVQVSAISTDLKNTYQPKETLIVKVIGDIVEPIQDSQVFFKRNNVFVPLEYDVGRVGQNWYVWAIAPQTSGNYTLILDNIVSSAGSGVKTEDYQKNFSVNGSIIQYNVRPGFIVSNTDFIIDLEYFAEEDTIISTNFPSPADLEIRTGLNVFEFSIDGKVTGSYNVVVGSYSIPAYLTTNNVPANTTVNSTNSTNGTTQGNSTNMTNSTIQNQTITNQSSNTSSSSTSTINTTTNVTTSSEANISIEPYYIQRFLHKQAKISTYNFTVENFGNRNYKNIQIVYNKSLFDIEDDEFDLKANSSYSFIIELGKYPGYDLRERIYINGTNFSFEIPFFVRYSENVTDVAVFYGGIASNTSNGTTRKANYFCSELGGVVCSTNSQCRGEGLTSKEGSCCLGICEQPKGGSSLWGWLIGIIAIGILVWLYMKYKKTEGSVPDSLKDLGP